MKAGQCVSRGCLAAVALQGLAATLVNGAASAAALPSCHALDGHWTLEPEKGNLGSGLSFNPYYAINGAELELKRTGTRIAERWHFTGPHLDRVTRYEYATDGLRHASQLTDPMDFEYAAMAADWQNCTLVETGYSHLFGLEVATTNSYFVSVDGRELTIVQYGESPISVVDRRLVFRHSVAEHP